jgi:uncharacterized membrane protein
MTLHGHYVEFWEGSCTQERFRFARTIMRWLIAVLFAAAGIAHLTVPQEFLKITPDWVPFARTAIVVTGIFEIVCAAALFVPAGLGLTGAIPSVSV